MNKKIISAIVVVILVIVAVFVIWEKKHSVNDDTESALKGDKASATSQQQPAASSPQSLKDLLTSSSSMKCTFSEGASQGEFYIASGKARGEFTQSSGQKAHMIMADQTSYFWMDGAAQGFKASLNQSSTAPTAANGSPTGVDPNKKANYSCAPTSVEASMFTPPASVKFLDTSEMMKMPTPK